FLLSREERAGQVTPLNFKSISVPLPGAFATTALGINDRGNIVGSLHGGRSGWNCSSRLLIEPDRGINAQGDIVGLYFDSAGKGDGFLRNVDSFISIDVPGAAFSAAVGINPEGTVVGRYDVSGKQHGFPAKAGRAISLRSTSLAQSQLSVLGSS